jgi:hypothetical protein
MCQENLSEGLDIFANESTLNHTNVNQCARVLILAVSLPGNIKNMRNDLITDSVYLSVIQGTKLKNLSEGLGSCHYHFCQ